MNAESFSKEQLTRNASTTLSVSKYQRNNFHYFQTKGTTGILQEILSEHTPELAYAFSFFSKITPRSERVRAGSRARNDEGERARFIYEFALSCSAPITRLLERRRRRLSRGREPVRDLCI